MGKGLSWWKLGVSRGVKTKKKGRLSGWECEQVQGKAGNWGLEAQGKRTQGCWWDEAES
jgi:hypothetical protein